MKRNTTRRLGWRASEKYKYAHYSGLGRNLNWVVPKCWQTPNFIEFVIRTDIFRSYRKIEWFLWTLSRIEWFLGTTGTTTNEATAKKISTIGECTHLLWNNKISLTQGQNFPKLFVYLKKLDLIALTLWILCSLF